MNCGLMDGSDVLAATAHSLLSWFRFELSRLSIPGTPGPRLLAGAMHVAWRHHYPVVRAGRSSKGEVGVYAPYSRETGPRLLAGAMHNRVKAALPVQPCGILLYEEDRRVASSIFPRRPDPASSPE